MGDHFGGAPFLGETSCRTTTAGFAGVIFAIATRPRPSCHTTVMDVSNQDLSALRRWSTVPPLSDDQQRSRRCWLILSSY